MGPSGDQPQFEKVHEFLDIGRNEGVQTSCGGGRADDGDLAHGLFTQPTVWAGVTPEMRVAKEEIFGPVLSVLAVDDIDEAIAVANNVEYGLTSSVYTQDINIQMFKLTKQPLLERLVLLPSSTVNTTRSHHSHR